MFQGYVKVLGIHLRSETFLAQTYRLLRQQSYINSQVYEAPRKFVSRNQPYSKTITVQMLCSPDSSIQFSALVL